MDDFTQWYMHGISSGYFQRVAQQNLLPMPMMYQPPMQMMYQPPTQVLPQMSIYQPPQPQVEETKNVLARALDPRLKSLPETDPRRVRMEKNQHEDKKLVETNQVAPPAKTEPYPEHSICVKWLKKQECNGSCKRQHYRYTAFKMKMCKYWVDNNCRYSDPVYCNHSHGHSDPYSHNDYQRESGFKRGRF